VRSPLPWLAVPWSRDASMNTVDLVQLRNCLRELVLVIRVFLGVELKKQFLHALVIRARARVGVVRFLGLLLRLNGDFSGGGFPLCCVRFRTSILRAAISLALAF